MDLRRTDIAVAAAAGLGHVVLVPVGSRLQMLTRLLRLNNLRFSFKNVVSLLRTHPFLSEIYLGGIGLTHFCAMAGELCRRGAQR